MLLVIAHVLGALTSVRAVMQTRTPQGAIAWVVSLNTFPYVAVPAYWVLGRSEFNGYVVARADNLDNRSFRLNFEITMIFEDAGINEEVATMLEKDFGSSRLVPATDYTNQDFLFRLGVKLARLTAPIL